jgi:hypothetical protein
MRKQVIGAQGEITIIKIDAIPANAKTRPATARNAKGHLIVSHSESGNHHVITDGDLLERTDAPDGMQIFYAIFPKALVQDAPVPHGSYDLPDEFYEMRIAREFDPFEEQSRRVAD